MASNGHRKIPTNPAGKIPDWIRVGGQIKPNALSKDLRFPYEDEKIQQYDIHVLAAIVTPGSVVVKSAPSVRRLSVENVCCRKFDGGGGVLPRCVHFNVIQIMQSLLTDCYYGRMYSYPTGRVEKTW